ncbi:MAG TPA: hypothetical protein PLG17_03725, partial [Thermodesulfobacteriota bacterium]|nr:hypothetical protein [Thermodesulfobacteriota bacterium]
GRTSDALVAAVPRLTLMAARRQHITFVDVNMIDRAPFFLLRLIWFCLDLRWTHCRGTIPGHHR